MKAYQIKITLMDSKPFVWRRVIVPAEISFMRLHDVIQFSVGWHDVHLYEFQFSDQKFRITDDIEAYEQYCSVVERFQGKPPSLNEDTHGFLRHILEWTIKRPEKVKIDKFLLAGKPLLYVYDFGDEWKHEVALEAVIEDYPHGYPVCLDGEGTCPPEDVGGVEGYEEFLTAWSDIRHPEHDATVQWAKAQYYREFKIDEINHVMREVLKLKKVK